VGLFNESEFIAFRCILVSFRKEPAFLLDFVGEDPIALILSNLVGDFRMGMLQYSYATQVCFFWVLGLGHIIRY
jgi:hypothetical protein